jgi:hypothetical protein
MTPDQMHQAERHASLTAVAHALTAFETGRFLAAVHVLYPRLRGAGVADVLDLTTDHDMFLAETESFFEQYGEQLHRQMDASSEAPRAAAHALILLGRPLTVENVTALLTKAGVIDGPAVPEVPAYDPVHDLAVLVMWTDYDHQSEGGEVSQSLSRLRHWLPLPARLEDVEAALRGLLERQDS